MRAALRIQARVSNAQPLHRTPADQMLGDNLFRVLWAHAAVPHRLRIDHHRGAVLALVQTAGLVDSHPAGQSGLLAQLIEPRVQLAGSIAGAGGPGRIGRANIVADKNVALEYGQTRFSPDLCFLFFIRITDPGESRARDGARAPAAHPATFHIPSSQPGPICDNECLTMSTDNLLSLKDDMVAFIEGHGLRRLPGYVTEDIPSILWEGRGNPDAWKDFVEMAKHVGAPFVTFSEMTMEREELDALIEEAGEMNFPDEEATELVEAKWLRKYAGMLGYIQLGFVYQGLVFLHETTTEWYERFQTLVEDIEAFQDIVIDDTHPRDEEEE